MRRLVVARKESVREKGELETMMEEQGAGGGGGEGRGGAPPPPPRAVPAPATTPKTTTTPETKPKPAPGPPPPRARMPLLCRTAAILLAGYGLYLLTGLLAGAVAAALTAAAAEPRAALVLLGAYLSSELAFHFFYWRPRYLWLSRAPPPHRPSRAEAMAQFERVLALRGRLRAAVALRGPVPSSPRSVAARQAAIAERERLEVEQYLSGWFRGCDASKVRRDNVKDLLSMGFFFHSPGSASGNNANANADDNDPSSPPPPSPAELEAMVKRLEDAWELSFPPGHDPTLRLMDHLNEPLRCLPYPYVFYLGVELIAALSRLVLLAAGFRRHTYRHELKGSKSSNAQVPKKYLELDYYMLRGARQAPWPSSSCSSATTNDATVAAAVAAAAAGPPPAPLIFIHGVGGLFPFYTHLLVRIAAGASGVLSPNGAFLAVDLPHVSLKFRRAGVPVPTAGELAEAVAALAERVEAQQRRRYDEQLAVLFGGGRGGGEGGAAAAAPLAPRPQHTGAVFVAHSYGSLVAARLVRAHRSSVAGLVLVDPVCLCMFLPQLLGAFVYGTARPHHHQGRRRPLAASLRLLGLRLISREATLAATMARAFYWSEMNIWPEDLPDGSVIVLGGRDELLDAPQVLALLESAATAAPGGGVGPAAAAAAPVPHPPNHHHHHHVAVPPSLEVVEEEEGPTAAGGAPAASRSSSTTGALAFLFPPPATATTANPTASTAPPPTSQHPRIRVMYETDLFHGALLINKSVRAALLSELRASLLKAAAASLKRVGGALGGAGSALDRRAQRAAGRAGAAVRRTRTTLADLLGPTPISPSGASGASASFSVPSSSMAAAATTNNRVPSGLAPASSFSSSSARLLPFRSFTAGMAPIGGFSSPFGGEVAAGGAGGGDGGGVGVGGASSSSDGGDNGGWTHVSSLEAELRAMMMAQKKKGKGDDGGVAAAPSTAGKGEGEDDDDDDEGQGC